MFAGQLALIHFPVNVPFMFMVRPLPVELPSMVALTFSVSTACSFTSMLVSIPISLPSSHDVPLISMSLEVDVTTVHVHFSSGPFTQGLVLRSFALMHFL